MSGVSSECKGCRFYARHSGCRRRAPILIPNLGSSSAYYPRVGEDDWCGEFESLAATEEERAQRVRSMMRKAGVEF